LVGGQVLDASSDAFKEITREVAKTLNIEKLVRPTDISAVPQDFFQKVNEALQQIGSEVERERLTIQLESLIMIRIPKIARMAATSKLTPELSNKLAKEEIDFFVRINSSAAKLRLETLK
jgi:hypothetical protein